MNLNIAEEMLKTGRANLELISHPLTDSECVNFILRCTVVINKQKTKSNISLWAWLPVAGYA